MKKAKIQKKQNITREFEGELYSIKNMIKVCVCLLLVFVVFYFITYIIVNNRNVQDENNIAVIDSTKITLNQLLNREEEEYFVIATKASLYKSSYVNTNYINLYNDYINSYKQKEGAYTFYYVDLDNALNKKYVSDNLKITNNLEELQLNDEVLFKIKNGKIEKNYVGKEKILDKLSRM